MMRMVSTPAGDPHDEREIAFLPADGGGATTLSQEQIDDYNAHGYLHPLSIFDEREVVETSAYVDELFRKFENENDGRDNYALLSYHVRCAGLYDLTMNPRILDIVQDIIGPDIICWTSHLI